MKKLLSILFLAAFTSTFSINAQSPEKPAISLSKFEALPVLESGRYKPLDSIARNTLLTIYGKSSFKNSDGKKLSATEWLAKLLFMPQDTADDKLFLVDNPYVVNALGIKTITARGHYSYKELSASFETFEKLVNKAYDTEEAKRGRFETHLLELYQKVITYSDTGHNLMNTTDQKSRTLWFNMATGYITHDQKFFDDSVDAYTASLGDKITPEILEKVRSEVTFNNADPFFRSGLLLGVAIVVCIIGFYVCQKFTTLTAMALCIGAFLLQTYGIYCRMVIMGRPPVTNLYSTFICTSWTCILIGVGIYFVLPEKFKRISPLAAALSGVAFLIISGKYNTGDNMGVMVAVLNSNFWLATHVTTIILGYAGCCFSGLFAHFYLISRITNSKDPQLTQVLYKLTLGILGFGFTATFIGTVLGGIWADQSWGRFWGWDPKENGALLIVLWCAVIFHAKVGNLVKKQWIAVGSILCIQVVMLAWFGINKLGVGLHSYGNDPNSNAIRNLIIFAIAELVFILIVPAWGTKKLKKQ